MAGDYFRAGAAFKTDLTDKLSIALILDQPFGANVDYADANYPLGTNKAEINSFGMTAVARYRFNESFSIHGGLRYVAIDAHGALFVDNSLGLPRYDVNVERDSSLGYVIGAAFERPDIALRVALTYSSELDFSHRTQAGLGGAPLTSVANTDYTMPQSVNLEFQTGVAKDTLVFGSVRWAEWTATTINTVGYPVPPLIANRKDPVSWTLGVGRKFTDRFSGALILGYEGSAGGLSRNLSPNDGYRSITLGGSYMITDNAKISGAISYIDIGNATTTIGQFDGNSAIGAGLKISYSF
jgi:long-subunit fatty acid transport protein